MLLDIDKISNDLQIMYAARDGRDRKTLKDDTCDRSLSVHVLCDTAFPRHPPIPLLFLPILPAAFYLHHFLHILPAHCLYTPPLSVHSLQRV